MVQHNGKVGPAEAHAAEKIGLDDFVPIVIGDLVEGLRLINAEVVDENVDFGKALVNFGNVIGLTKVASKGFELCLGMLGVDFFDGLGHAVVGAAINDDL